MKHNIFEYNDYKKYLTAWIQDQPHRGHGQKSKIAATAGCNTTYMTQVLKGNAHFSFEQAERVSSYLGHQRNETLFFLLLIQFARAGTPSLRQLIKEQITQAVHNHFNLKNRLEFKKNLTPENQAIYHSAWHYSAIHVVLAMKAFQTKAALSNYFGLPLTTVNEALHFLTNAGLVTEKQGRYEIGSVNIHLGKDSPMITNHHTNWRLRAIQSLQNHRASDFHYSSVITIAKADEPKIKSVFVKAIEDVRALVKNSKEDGAYCYNLDFFNLEK